MKKIYFKLIGLTMGVFMLASNKTNAQVYVIGNGEYATSVSNDGNVVVLFGLGYAHALTNCWLNEQRAEFP